MLFLVNIVFLLCIKLPHIVADHVHYPSSTGAYVCRVLYHNKQKPRVRNILHIHNVSLVI